MNQSQLGSFESIAIAAIRPSGTNPRKTFDPIQLAELQRSIEEMGITQPLLLRLKSTSRYFVKPSELNPEDGVVIYVCHPKGDISIAEAKDKGRYNIIETFSTGTREENLHWANAEVVKRGDPGYEIVSGERRFRAAKDAGLEFVPAIVAELTDAEALDIQMIENLQRADLHPVEEAEGYRALMATGATAEDVAKKAGKKLAYVQQRIALLKLEVDAKKLFADGHLTLDHALLLARITPRDQERAVCFLLNLRDWEMDKKLSVSENIAKHIAPTDYSKMTWMSKEHREKSAQEESSKRLVDPTAAQLKDWISSHLLLQLKGVPWDLGDATLLPVAGACTTCPKRAGANAALFSDITTVEDTCTDSVCFGDKQKAQLERQQSFAKEVGSPLLKLSAKASNDKLDAPVVELKPGPLAGKPGAMKETVKAVVVAKRAIKAGQYVDAKKGECAATVQGIFTDGPNTGKTRYVCADQNCKVHKHHVETPRKPNLQASAATSSAKKLSPEEIKYETEKHAWEEKRDRYVKAQILAMVYEQGTAKDDDVTRRLVRSLWQEVEYDVDKELIGEVMGLKPAKGQFSPKPSMTGAITAFIEKQREGELMDLAAVLFVAGESDDEPIDLAKKSGAGDPKSLVADFIAEFQDENAAPIKPSGPKAEAKPAKSPAAKKSPAKKATSGGLKKLPAIDGKSAGAGAAVEARA
jgi:ParB/RepB/Spo0J family partition protein